MTKKFVKACSRVDLLLFSTHNNSMKFVSFILMLIGPLILARAETPLVFPAARNHVEILAQNFVYNLIDDDRLRIGDVLVTASQVRMQTLAGTENRLAFAWPSSLISSGRLALLNNAGQAVWSEELSSQNLTISKKNETVDGEVLRGDIARLNSSPLPDRVWDDLKTYPFFTFCVSHETNLSKLYLCSPEYFLADSGQGIFKVRHRSQKVPRSLQINGSGVNPQGTVYLNKEKRPLFMRVELTNGVSIELLTRRGEIDFKDAVLSNDGKTLLITARGTQPVRPAQIKNQSGDDYQVALPADRPFYYLYGEGGVPVRQEFLINGPVPNEKDRPVVSTSSTRTFSSSVTLNGEHAEGFTVSGEGDSSKAEDTGNNKFSWTLSDLKTGALQRRYISLTKAAPAGGPPITYLGAYDLYRGLNHEAIVGLSIPLPSLLYRGSITYRQWIESLLWLPGDWAAFRWSWDLSYRLHISSSLDNAANMDILSLGLLGRFRSGFPYETPGWSAGLRWGQFTINSTTSTSIGLDVGYSLIPTDQSLHFLFPWVDWLDNNFRYWPSSSGSGDGVVLLQSSWQLESIATHRYGKNYFLKPGVGLSQYKTTLALPKESPQINFSVGFGALF